MNSLDIDIKFKKWCTATKRNGGVLIGSSIRELLNFFFKPPQRAEFSQEYLDWVSVESKKEGFKPLTSSQHLFAEWCLENKTMISQIGDMETIFKSITNHLKPHRSSKTKTQQLNQSN